MKGERVTVLVLSKLSIFWSYIISLVCIACNCRIIMMTLGHIACIVTDGVAWCVCVSVCWSH